MSYEKMKKEWEDKAGRLYMEDVRNIALEAQELIEKRFKEIKTRSIS